MTLDERLWHEAEVQEIVGDARLAYVAVMTSRGPHITPQLAGVAARRVWFVTTANSVKARMVRQRPVVALTAWSPGGERAVVLHGDAHVLDLAHPLELARVGLETILSGLGLASYVADNARELPSLLQELMSANGAPMNERRVVVTVHPDQVTLVPISPNPNAALAWVTRSGVRAVPVEWDETSAAAGLGPRVTDLLAGSPQSQAAVAIDETVPGDTPRHGALFRGAGCLDAAIATIDVERVTRWPAQQSAAKA